MTDYIVVGGGSAGCVLARRLVERRHCRVLLLEAGGPDDRPAIHHTDLRDTTSLWTDPDLTWQCHTEPQPGLAGRSITIAQGRVLGGGSSINAMLHVRGNRRDFDRWRDLGAEGWAYPDVLPYFAAAENFLNGDPAYRGAGGPLDVVEYPRPSAASIAFLRAARQLGYGVANGDYNAARQENIAFLYQSTRTRHDRRCSTAVAYLNPVLHSRRLTVQTGARVTRVLLQGTTAIGVEYLHNGLLRCGYADREVILACGALASPQLLLLSGIGPAAQLRKHGIEPVVDLPGVGANLHDHLVYGMAYESRRDLPEPGLLAEAGLFAYSQGQHPDGAPDLQYFFGPVFYAPERYRPAGPAFTIAPILVQPRSRGTVSLRSANPTDPPAVDPAYLADPADLDVLVRGGEIARELVHTDAFADLRGRELAPGESAPDANRLARYIRENASTVWHPVGTCRMGVDDRAVVSPRLAVHGIDRLRVADASVMPMITCGNTNAPTIMIAEKAADLIGAARTEEAAWPMATTSS